MRTACAARRRSSVCGLVAARQGTLGWELGVTEAIVGTMMFGFAVDYCVHLGHAFDHAVGEGQMTNREAAKHALERMGASIFQGGFTTLLGVVVLAFASSVAFRVFSRFVVTTVLLGVGHGMILLPVLLTYLTPRCKAASA